MRNNGKNEWSRENPKTTPRANRLAGEYNEHPIDPNCHERSNEKDMENATKHFDHSPHCQNLPQNIAYPLAIHATSDRYANRAK
jgi:hypothetical protein